MPLSGTSQHTRFRVLLASIGLYVGYRLLTTKDDADYSPIDDLSSTVSTIGEVLMPSDIPFSCVDPETGQDYKPMIISSARLHGVPPLLLAALLKQESAFRNSAIGPSTQYGRAKGLAQFVDSTAAEWGIQSQVPGSSIPGAARYLAWLWRRHGTWRLAVAAYNWGTGNVAKYGLANMPAETRNYVAVVYDKWGSELPA